MTWPTCPSSGCRSTARTLWDRLSHEQRLELSKQELASVASTGLWFEIILIQMLARYAYHRDPQDPHTQYALTEIGDETRHIIMFAKALDRMGTPTYRPNRFVHHLARLYKATARGTALFAPVLVAEEVTDRLQRATMNDESIHPLVRMVNRIHVVEEARHVRFAREEVARLMPRSGPADQADQQHRGRDRVGVRHQRPDQPAGLRRGRPRPEAGGAGRAQEPAPPADPPLAGREDHGVPGRAGHAHLDRRGRSTGSST